METKTETVHVFLEIDKNTKRKLEFETNRVTGGQIKKRGSVPLDSDLARRKGQKLELVTNEQTIQIKNGDHFIALPPGTIS